MFVLTTLRELLGFGVQGCFGSKAPRLTSGVESVMLNRQRAGGDPPPDKGDIWELIYMKRGDFLEVLTQIRRAVGDLQLGIQDVLGSSAGGSEMLYYVGLIEEALDDYEAKWPTVYPRGVSQRKQAEEPMGGHSVQQRAGVRSGGDDIDIAE